MYERYSALFALRNNGGEEAVNAIIESLSAKSALLRHEVTSNLNVYFCYQFEQLKLLTEASMEDFLIHMLPYFSHLWHTNYLACTHLFPD